MPRATYTTAEVATQVGRSKATVITTINRHPELRPARTFGQSFVWNASDLQRLAAHFGAARRGRPAKGV